MTAVEDHRIGRLPDPDDRDEAAYYDGVNAKRLVAWIIDTIIIGIIGTLLIPFTAFLAIFVAPVFYGLVGFFYYTLTMSGSSATWGMRLTGIEIRQADGSGMDFSTSAMHSILYYIAVAIFPLQLVSVVLMLASPRKQGLPDMILGTAPIRRSA